jgi:hypothetical protein
MGDLEEIHSCFTSYHIENKIVGTNHCSQNRCETFINYSHYYARNKYSKPTTCIYQTALY